MDGTIVPLGVDGWRVRVWPLAEVVVIGDVSADIWLMSSLLFRLATASSANRFENSTGDGGLGVTGGWGSVGGDGSSDRDGEILRSPALSLLILLSPILYTRTTDKTEKIVKNIGQITIRELGSRN